MPITVVTYGREICDLIRAERRKNDTA